MVKHMHTYFIHLDPQSTFMSVTCQLRSSPAAAAPGSHPQRRLHTCVLYTLEGYTCVLYTLKGYTCVLYTLEGYTCVLYTLDLPEEESPQEYQPPPQALNHRQTCHKCTGKRRKWGSKPAIGFRAQGPGPKALQHCNTCPAISTPTHQ